MSEIFVVIVEDRHTDVQAIVCATEEIAMRKAREALEIGTRGLTEEEVRADKDLEQDDIEEWLWNIVYSCEGDSIRVEKQELVTE